MTYKKFIFFLSTLFICHYQQAAITSPYPLLTSCPTYHQSVIFEQSGLASILKVSALFSISSVVFMSQYKDIYQDIKDNPYVAALILYFFCKGIYHLGYHEYQNIKQQFFNFYFHRISLLLIIAMHTKQILINNVTKSISSFAINQYLIESEQFIFKVKNLHQQLTAYFQSHFPQQPLFDYNLECFNTQQIINLASYDKTLHTLLSTFSTTKHLSTYKKVYNNLEKQFENYHKWIVFLHQL